MPLNLKILKPIVPGQDYDQTLQGNNPDNTPGSFSSADLISCTISQGQGLPTIFTVAPTWYNATLCQFILNIPAAKSGLLGIDDTYYGLASATRVSTGQVFPIAAFYLPTLPVPDTQAAAAPPDLVTVPFTAQLLGQLSLNEPQWEAIPTLITASSDATRAYCSRRFDQRTVVEEVPVDFQSGMIRLSSPPVNWIVRVQARPQEALLVSNSTADAAWIYPAATGDVTTGITITGIVLNWSILGANQTTTITYSGLVDQRISTLATAINAVGNGWSATADPVYGDFGVSELFDLSQSKGAATGDTPDETAILHVYGFDVSGPRFDADDGQNTGMVWVGRQTTSLARRWGQGGEELFGFSGGREQAKVKVTYNGGFAVVPRDIQLACVELVKYQLERLETPLLLKGETAGKYSYEINDAMLQDLPPWVRMALFRRKVINA